jgi:hypothetical protein
MTGEWPGLGEGAQDQRLSPGTSVGRPTGASWAARMARVARTALSSLAGRQGWLLLLCVWLGACLVVVDVLMIGRWIQYLSALLVSPGGFELGGAMVRAGMDGVLVWGAYCVLLIGAVVVRFVIIPAGAKLIGRPRRARPAAARVRITRKSGAVRDSGAGQSRAPWARGARGLAFLGLAGTCTVFCGVFATELVAVHSDPQQALGTNLPATAGTRPYVSPGFSYGGYCGEYGCDNGVVVPTVISYGISSGQPVRTEFTNNDTGTRYLSGFLRVDYPLSCGPRDFVRYAIYSGSHRVRAGSIPARGGIVRLSSVPVSEPGQLAFAGGLDSPSSTSQCSANLDVALTVNGLPYL